jgi:hypothetical protein
MKAATVTRAFPQLTKEGQIMDGETITTTTAEAENDLEQRLMHLVQDMEAEGYMIGMSRQGDSCWIKMPEGPVPDICCKARLNIALHENPDLEAAFLPFLRHHRPFSIWQVR